METNKVNIFEMQESNVKYAICASGWKPIILLNTYLLYHRFFPYWKELLLLTKFLNALVSNEIRLK